MTDVQLNRYWYIAKKKKKKKKKKPNQIFLNASVNKKHFLFICIQTWLLFKLITIKNIFAVFI